MGGGRWTNTSYTARTSTKNLRSGTVFEYDKTTKATLPRSKWAAHESVDPKKVNTDRSPLAGKNIRECTASDEHPNPTPIMVMFDVTGSMHRIPTVLQQKLPALHGLLQRKGYVEDPQICFGAIGDAYSDTIPLQVGQFESDDRADEALENLILEGGGGGGNHESYNLAAFFALHNTSLPKDRKGYLFIIGDERIYAQTPADQIKNYIGGIHAEHTDAVDTRELFKELQEKFHVFFLFASQGSYQPGDVLEDGLSTSGWSNYDGTAAIKWRELLGQNALILEDADAVCETIGMTLGVMEGTVSYEDGIDDLKDVTDEKSAAAAGKALANIGAAAGAVAVKASGELPDLTDKADSGATSI